MWYEYPVPANFQKQKEIIRKLRTWIQLLEKEKFIVGFAFNHYFQFPTNPNEPDELRIRFEYADETKRENVEAKLEEEVKRLVPDYIKKERVWGDDSTPQHVLQAYEFGSRCAFLAWELVESKRFPEEYFSQSCIGEAKEGIIAKKVPVEFQTHFNHGVMNSLGIPKFPDERLVHINNLMDSTNSRTKQELIKWLQENIKGQ